MSAQGVLLKFRRLDAADRRALIAAALLLVAFMLAVSLFSFQTVLRCTVGAEGDSEGRNTADPREVGRTVWAVEAAGRRVPGATCLVQSFALLLLLRRLGQSASLQIGVSLDESSRLSAHAWVESQGRVLIGGAGQERFTPLRAFQPDVQV
ncbi:MAG: hypothetical protein QOH49_3899 [Acidobacteriota bacterium]|jgi:hypothetical protein|nr:hypothetical protein [Acidobacteriota bacterium]